MSDGGTRRVAMLSDLVGGRDNNFNLLRFLAASAVLVSHCFALSTGDKMAEPLRSWLDVTPGMIAVDIFFVTSGFLVTASLLSRQNVASFLSARALRIYPALIVAVLLTVLVVGLMFSSWSPAIFFSDLHTWRYLARTSTLVFGIDHVLPGSFEDTPWRGAVNASLWTLPYEIGMYAALASLWTALRSAGASARRDFAKAAMVMVGLALAVHFALLLLGRSSALVLLTAMFFAGSGIYIARDRVPMNHRLFAALMAVLGLSLMNRTAFHLVYPFVLPYLVFFLAYVPSGAVRRFNQVGDYSYGIYIYAWPVQQMCASLWPGVTPLQMLTVAFPTTLALAVASWHLVEKRALALGRLQRLRATAAAS